MLELPAALTKNFGMGPRTFSTKTGPKTTQDRSWTRAPTDGPVEESEQQNETDEPTDEKDVLEYMASLKRDSDMEKVANQLREKRGTESLMERHAKKLKKAQEKEEASGRPKERRPFDRDIDLSANQFDEAKKKQMMKRASQLNDRFSSGGQKYL